MDEVLKIVKMRLGLSDDNQDDLISTYIEEIGNRIKHFCNINSIPKALHFVWASMVIDVLRVEQSSKEEFAANDGGFSIKLGDASISPANSNGVTSTNKSVIEKVVLNYQEDLIRYRKLRW